MTFTTHAGSRKCCPNRLRGFALPASPFPASPFPPFPFPPSPFPLVILATPVALLDLFDLLFAEPEVVPDLVDQRLANAIAHIVLGLAILFDHRLEQRDAVRQRVAVAPRALGERRSLIQRSEE